MIHPCIHTTGIHFTGTSIEWAVLRKSRKGTETLRKGNVALESTPSAAPSALFPVEPLAAVRRNFRGIVTVSLPADQLLMKMLELPSTDPDELRSMVELQVDHLSPFPLDQLTVSYEAFSQSETHSRVLAVAAPRTVVDALGDAFKEQHVHIHSLDAEVLAWWSLLVRQDQIPGEGRSVLLIEEHTEFALIVIDDGLPVCVRSLALFHHFDDPSVLHEIADEIRYTLLSLESTYGHREISSAMIWSESDVPMALCAAVQSACGAEPSTHDLHTLPPLCEGLALRSAEHRLHHVELVPKEWIDLQHRRRLLKAAAIGTLTICGLWLLSVAVLASVFTVRQTLFNRVKRDADRYAAPARAAQAAREEMLSLEKYADRTHSALETLREVTVTLPAGVEIASFTYKKGEAVSLRGSAERADEIYSYFRNLGESTLFEGIKDQPVSTRTIRDRRISTFSITAELPKTGREASE